MTLQLATAHTTVSDINVATTDAIIHVYDCTGFHATDLHVNTNSGLVHIARAQRCHVRE